MIACCTMKLFLLGVGLCSAQVSDISCYVIRISAYLLKKRLGLDTFSYICIVMFSLVNILCDGYMDNLYGDFRKSSRNKFLKGDPLFETSL